VLAKNRGVALDYASLPNDTKALKQELLKRDAWVEALKAEVLRLRHWQFGRSAESFDLSVAPELPLAGGEVAAAEPLEPSNDAPQIPRLVSVDAPQPTWLSRRPAHELPADLPRVIRVHAPASCSCPECHGALRPLGEDASEQLDYVPGYVQVIRHMRPKLACRACARIVRSAAPSRTIERVLPTAWLLAQVIGTKCADHFALYRQEGIYRRSGVELPRASLASWVGEAASLLDPLVGVLERYVLASHQAVCRRCAGAGARTRSGSDLHGSTVGLCAR